MILIHPHHSIWLESILLKLSSEEGLDHFKTDVRNETCPRQNLEQHDFIIKNFRELRVESYTLNQYFK